MPHIYSSGTDMGRSVQYINIHAEVRFKNEYFNSPKAQQKMLEIQADLEAVLQKYFDDIAASEIMSNHEHNLLNSQS